MYEVTLVYDTLHCRMPCHCIQLCANSVTNNPELCQDSYRDQVDGREEGAGQRLRQQGMPDATFAGHSISADTLLFIMP